MSATADQLVVARGFHLRADALLALAAGCACAAAMLDPAAVVDGPVVCPFRLATGLPCPGCGSVRAWTAAAHGDAAAALAFNPFATITFAAVVVLVAWRLVAGITRIRRPDLGRLAASVPTRAFVGAWIVWGLLRAVTAW